MIKKISDFRTALKTIIRKKMNSSDYFRWGEKSSFHSVWDERTFLMSKFVPSNSSVIEFGAGNMALKKYLPKGSLYLPSDFISRGNDDIYIYNLNEKELQSLDKTYDVAFFGGVIEYVNDVPRLLKHLSSSFPCIICSYAVVELNTGLVYRRRSGWVNDYDLAEFLQMFHEQDYECIVQEKWNDQYIFLFEQN